MCPTPATRWPHGSCPRHTLRDRFAFDFDLIGRLCLHFIGGGLMMVVRGHRNKPHQPTTNHIISPRHSDKNVPTFRRHFPSSPSSASPRFCAFSFTLKGRIRHDTLSCPFMSCQRRNDRAMGLGNPPQGPVDEVYKNGYGKTSENYFAYLCGFTSCNHVTEL